MIQKGIAGVFQTEGLGILVFQVLNFADTAANNSGQNLQEVANTNFSTLLAQVPFTGWQFHRFESCKQEPNR